MRLPGRMDRRWKGLLSHQQLSAARHGTVPHECHLHLRRARSGRSSHSMPPSVQVLNHCAVPQLALPTLFSSPNPPLPHGHNVISTWCSLPKTVSLNSSPSAPPFLCDGGLAANTILVSTLVDVRYKGLLEILISVIPLKSILSYKTTEKLIHHV